MRQYSLVIYTPVAVAIPDPLLLLGEGINVVSFFTDDIEKVKADIEAEGCTIKETNLLAAGPTTPEDILVDGETPEQHGLLASSEP